MSATDTILDLATTKNADLVHSPEWFARLQEAVNDLMVNDFNGLIQLLYRLDVSEYKIQSALFQNPETDSSILIARLIVDRQLQKLKDIKHFSSPKPDNEEDRW
jgi:hypothetical protein